MCERSARAEVGRGGVSAPCTAQCRPRRTPVVALDDVLRVHSSAPPGASSHFLSPTRVAEAGAARTAVLAQDARALDRGRRGRRDEAEQPEEDARAARGVWHRFVSLRRSGAHVTLAALHSWATAGPCFTAPAASSRTSALAEMRKFLPGARLHRSHPLQYQGDGGEGDGRHSRRVQGEPRRIRRHLRGDAAQHNVTEEELARCAAAERGRAPARGDTVAPQQRPDDLPRALHHPGPRPRRRPRSVGPRRPISTICSRRESVRFAPCSLLTIYKTLTLRASRSSASFISE